MPAKKIVIIDDCALTRQILQDLLEDAGYQVATAESGMKANQHIYTEPQPDLVIMDVEMPNLNGDRKVRLLRSREESHQLPILLISAKSEEEMASLVEYSGASGFLRKPINPETVLTEIDRYL